MLVTQELTNKHCLNVLVRQRWFMGECRDEAECLYLELETLGWIEVLPNKQQHRWIINPCKQEQAFDVLGDGDSHFPIEDLGLKYSLNNLVTAGMNQQRLGDRIEFCVEFTNLTAITLHYNVATNESSLYVTHE